MKKVKEYSYDKPINRFEEDVFGRAGFAERVADTIAKESSSDGYVVGLYSEWGYGKTSTINLIKKSLAKSEDLVVASYNPWVYLDQGSMIEGLFSLFANSLGESLKGKKEKLGKLLKDYSSVLSVIPVAGTGVAGLANAGGTELSNTSLEELKGKVENLILGSKKRIVVIVDDVDRLDKEELFQLFKLIKIGVDFKNVVYLVAFDDKVAGEALSTRFGASKESGSNFIEKIVQVPLHLPMINKDLISSYVLTGIENLLKENNIEISETEVHRFRAMFDELVLPLIRTPRMCNRYLNSLRFVIPLVGEEINIVDLLIIEAIRVLYPEEYKSLRHLKNDVSGTGNSSLLDEKEAKEALTEKIGKIVSENKLLLELLKELFPVVDNAFKHYGGSYIDPQELRKLKRVASEDYFDRYFTYGVSAGDVPDSAVKRIIQEADPKEMARMLSDLIKDSDLKAVVHKIRTYESDISDGTNLINAVMSLQNEISEPLSSGFDTTPLENIAKMLVTLAGNCKEDAKKIQLISRAIDEITNLDLLSYLVRWINATSDDKSASKLFNEKQNKELLQVAKKRIAFLALKEPLYKTPYRLAHYNYHTWKDNGGGADVLNNTSQSISTLQDVYKFLTRYSAIWFGNGAPKHGDFDQSAYSFMSQVVDPNHLVKIIRTKKPGVFKVKEYISFPEGSNEVGKETTKDFKETILKQFIYVHHNSQKKEEEDQ